MRELLTPGSYRVYPKGPNFLLIVILSGIALIVMMILAYLLISGIGDVLLPSVHHDGEATARLASSILGKFIA